jgi:hypothetical protein
VPIIDRNLRYALEEVTDHIHWLRYASKESHHIDLDEIRERPAYGWIYRLARATCTTYEHGELVVCLLERSILGCRLYAIVK